MVSALDFRSEGRWFIPGFVRRVVSLDYNVIPPCLSPPGCINGYRRLNSGGEILRWTSIPSGGGVGGWGGM